jgi:hypothetical protein
MTLFIPRAFCKSATLSSSACNILHLFSMVQT